MNELQTTTTTTDVAVYKEKALEYLSSMGNKLPAKHQTQFIEMASAFGLNPFKREIYAVGYGDNWNIITGYEVYLKRAERIGKLDGWNCTVEGKGEDMTATVTIYRKDWKMPFTHTVLFSEVCQKTKDGRLNSVWGKMPSFMCRKVAIAQGFRLCFPDEFGGMPYTADEMPDLEQMKDVTPVEPVESVKSAPSNKIKKAKKEEAPKYTREQAEELGEVMLSIYPDNSAIFSEEEKTSYRNLLMIGEFETAIEQAKEIKLQRIELFNANKPTEPTTEEIEAELDPDTPLF